MENHRKFLKANLWGEWGKVKTDQKQGKPAPPSQKPYDENAALIELIAPEDITVGGMSMIEAIDRRRSRRKFTGEPLTLEELSFLLWATQGLSKVVEQVDDEVVHTMRTVPSGGSRHPFETYLLINHIEGIEFGLYRYLPLVHKMYLIDTDAELAERIHEASYRQFVMDSAVVFIWTAIPYRSEWRYSMVSHKIIAQDSGHMCQNLYLAVESIGAGMCAVGAYDQDKMDPILRVDGKEEFTIYMAPVGKIK